MSPFYNLAEGPLASDGRLEEFEVDLHLVLVGNLWVVKLRKKAYKHRESCEEGNFRISI